MRTRVLAIVAFLFFRFSTYSQSLAWAKQTARSNDNKLVTSITVDDDGNVYTLGNFRTQADFDPGPGVYNLTAAGTGINAVDIFISKLDHLGDLVWVKQIGGTGIDAAGSITLDKSGNLYLVGWYSDSTDFDPGPGVYNLTATRGQFLLKLDASGNFLFVKEIPGAADKVIIDNDGNILLTCDITGSTLDFDPGPSIFNITDIGSNDVIVVKLTANGDFIWAKQIAGPGSEIASTLLVDDNNNILITGFFYSTCDFDPGPLTYNLTSAGLGDVFVAKLDASGNFLWAKRIGGSENQNAFDIKLDSAENIFLTGFSAGTADFDPGPGTVNLTSAGDDDFFLAKLDSQGNYVWANLMGSPSAEDGHLLSIDQSGNITVIGGFDGSFDLDPGNGIARVSTFGIYDVYIARYNSSGNFITAKQIGGQYWDGCDAAFMDKAGNLYMTGSFQGDVDFDPGPRQYTLTGPVSTSSVPTDLYVVKFNKSNQITGTTFQDSNHDGIKQASEFALPNIPVNATNNGYIYQVRSDSDGVYVIDADTGSYSIVVPALAYYPSVMPSAHTVDFGSQFGLYDTANHFALQPIGDVRDLRVALTDVTRLRVGRGTLFQLTYQNMGTVPMSGAVTVALDSTLFLHLSQPPENNYVYPTITYSFSNLTPSATVNVNLFLGVSLSASLGDMLTSVAVINPLTGDVAPLDNIDTLRTLITGGYDPNDKSVTPPSPISPGFISKGSYLDYIIRFQNTGNDTTFDVIVKDTLSDNLDITSLQMISASHDYTIVQKGNNIEWHFNNILLPDSNHNESESHGFVRYRIKPVSNLGAGAEIRNKAAIYFDFNAPVMTNETSTVVEVITAVTNPPGIAQFVKVFPNPAGDFVKLVCKGSFRYSLYTSSGQKVIAVSNARDEAIIHTNTLQKGIYFLTLTNSKGEGNYKIVVQ